MDPLFNVGDIVKVDDKDNAFILSVDIQAALDGSFLYKIKYVVGDHVESNVEERRLHPTTILSSPASTRNGINRHSSSLNRRSETSQDNATISRTNPHHSSSHNTTSSSPSSCMASSSSSPRTTSPSSSSHPISSNFNATTHLTPFEKLKQSIKESRRWKPWNKTPIPLHKHLCDSKSKNNGWLREILPFKNKKKHLNNQENSLLLMMTSIFTLQSAASGPALGWVSLMAKAWGINQKTISRQIDSFVDNDFTCERKERSDKGTSIFNSEKKRKATFTPINEFKKAKYAEFREDTARLDHAQLQHEYDALTICEKNIFENKASINLQRSAHLWEELKDFLLMTKGKVSFITMSNHLEIASYNAIRNFFIQQDRWDMRKDIILPHLDHAAKERRLQWTCDWWMFWKSVRTIPVQKAAIVLVHMDEKWFYAVRTRSNTVSICPRICRRGHNTKLKVLYFNSKVLYCMLRMVSDRTRAKSRVLSETTPKQHNTN